VSSFETMSMLAPRNATKDKYNKKEEEDSVYQQQSNYSTTYHSENGAMDQQIVNIFTSVDTSETGNNNNNTHKDRQEANNKTTTEAPSDVPSSVPNEVPTVTPTQQMGIQNQYPYLIEMRSTWNYILGECQGDCDDDSDCDWGLVCYQRVNNKDPVPRCSGTGVKNWDYCHTPELNQLVSYGNNGEPQENYPLHECQGDCDYDYDCAYGLVCMHRDDMEEVPGCIGIGRSGFDYCYKPAEGSLVLHGIGGLPTSSYPLQKCQGDCRQDIDCSSGLKCLVRTATEAIPGCTGTGEASFGYCYDPADAE
jgi:hypothetical protein